MRLGLNQFRRVSMDGNFDIFSTWAIVSERGVWIDARFLICSNIFWLQSVHGYRLLKGIIVRPIVNLTSAQLGHWSNVVTFLGNYVSPASLHCNSVCSIRRDSSKFLGGGTEGSWGSRKRTEKGRFS